MKQFTVAQNDAGQRAGKFTEKAVKKLPSSLMYKYFRLKRIKINGKAVKPDYRLEVGDVIQMYINDEFFEETGGNEEFMSLDGNVSIVYEDDNILLVSKPFGLIVHSDNGETRNTLINQVKAYLWRKGEYDPVKEQSFTPALCNRIDRNTGGIVIVAKNAASLRELNDEIKEKSVGKFYLLRVAGVPPASGELKSFLLKDEKTNTVRSFDHPVPGAKTAITRFKTVRDCGDGSALVEAELLTGRTHQIRVQFADCGHPLLGDGKYGDNRINRLFPFRYQALFAYKVVFTESDGALGYLCGKSFTAEPPDGLK